MILGDFQRDAIARVYGAWDNGARNVMLVIPTGGGKCLGRGTPVLMFDGKIKPVEEIQSGDLLMGPDSKPRRVMSLARGQEMMYRVTPVKGESYVVNESHILSLKTTSTRNGSRASDSTKGGRVVNLSVREYLNKSKNFKHTHKGWRTGVEFPLTSNSLPLPPWILGAWLGDGMTGKLAITTGDDEIACEFVEYAKTIGMRIRVEENSEKSINIHLRSGKGTYGRGGSPFGNALRSLGIFSDKRIPDCYKIASREDRLELLAGILDTDGYNSGKGFHLTLKSEKLLDDVVFVARSLGFSAYKSAVRKTCCNNGVVGTYYSCSINGSIDKIPCRIPKKKAKPRRQKKDPLVTGIKVEPIGVDDYFGFEIDGDRLFMLGDFTVTHNTVCFCYILRQHDGYAYAVAHRQELVSQIALGLNREGVPHGIVAPRGVIEQIVRLEMEWHGKSYYQHQAPIKVASVNSLAKMPIDPRTTLVVMDEGHHVLRENMWGRAMAKFPNARGLFPTAHAVRGDGKGLGRSSEGLVDDLVIGPCGRDLIYRGFLTDYGLRCPPSDINLDQLKIGSGGEFQQEALRAAHHQSKTLIGDVVSHYVDHAGGKLWFTFAVDIDSAQQIQQAYWKRHVNAEIITAHTPIHVRAQLMKRFRARDILQLVSVDTLGEGVDVPAVEGISMARASASWQVMCQQAGRMMRVNVGDHMGQWHGYTDNQRLQLIAESSKPRGLLFDHVGNIARHYEYRKFPCSRQQYSLDKAERRSRSKSDAIPLTTCLRCFFPYERILRACPICSFPRPAPVARTMEVVEGSLGEVDPAILAELHAAIAKVDGPPEIYGDNVVAHSIAKNHRQRQESQAALRSTIALWAGYHRTQGLDDDAIQRTFWFRYQVDIATAQTLASADAVRLQARLIDELNRLNVRAA